MKKEIVISVDIKTGATQMTANGITPYEIVGLLTCFKQQTMDQMKAELIPATPLSKVEGGKPEDDTKK